LGDCTQHAPNGDPAVLGLDVLDSLALASLEQAAILSIGLLPNAQWAVSFGRNERP